MHKQLNRRLWICAYGQLYGHWTCPSYLLVKSVIRSTVVLLSAFSFGLKLVDSRRGTGFLFDLYLFILILSCIKKSCCLFCAQLTAERNTKMPPSSSPHLQVLPGLDLLRDDKHFLFSLNSLGKNLILVFSYSCQLLQSKIEQNTRNSSPVCLVAESNVIKIWFFSRNMEWQTWTILITIILERQFFNKTHVQFHIKSQQAQTDHNTEWVHISLHTLRLQSLQSGPVVHSVHQLWSSLQVVGQVKILHWEDRENKDRLLWTDAVPVNQNILGDMTRTFFRRIHKKRVLVALFSLGVQKVELTLQPLYFLEGKDKQWLTSASGLEKDLDEVLRPP